MIKERLLTIFNAVIRRTKNREDTELEQAFIRVAIVLSIFIYIYASNNNETPSAEYEYCLLLIEICLLVSLGIVSAIIIRPGVSIYRRVFGISFDNLGFSFFLATTQGMAAPWYGIYLWVAFGNGLRFGQNYLYLSATLSVIGFSGVLYVNDYWHNHLSLGLGLLMALIVLPSYAGALTHRINQEKKRAEEANKAKSEFLARMSHEIRTPLNGIIATGELLKSCNLGAEEKEYTNTIQNSGTALLGIIEDILDFSKIEAGKLLLENIKFDFHELAISTTRLFSTQAKKKHLKLDYHIDYAIPPYLIGDPTHIQQVLTNLIGNALKFTHEGFIQLSCQTIKSDDTATLVRFEISDSGIGMSEQTQLKIFDMFTQADESTTREFGGTGLGTTIAKQLVELMGGSIGVKSEPGIGTTFWFEIPLKRPQSLSISEQAVALKDVHLIHVHPESAKETEVSDHLKQWQIRATRLNSIDALLDLIASDDDSSGMGYIILLDHIPTDKLDDDDWENFNHYMASSGCQIIILDDAISTEFKEKTQSSPDVHHLYTTEQEMLFNALHLAMISQTQTAELTSDFNKNTPSLNILVAEDNSTNRLVIGRILEKAGHRFELVANGEEALHALEKRDYDLVITDMHMPVLGGLETFNIFRTANPEKTDIPFIMLTANATKEARVACSEAGINYFLTKPIATRKLLSILDAVALDHPPLLPSTDQLDTIKNNASEDQPVNSIVLDEVIKLAPSHEFLVELKNNFDQDSSALIKEMTKAIDANDPLLHTDSAHTLKGSASSLGLIKLQSLAYDAERLSPEKLRTEGREHIERIETAFQEAKAILAEAISTADNTPQ